MKKKVKKFNDLRELSYHLSVRETGIDIVQILINTDKMMASMYGGQKNWQKLKKTMKKVPYVPLVPKEIDPNRKSLFTWTETPQMADVKKQTMDDLIIFGQAATKTDENGTTILSQEEVNELNNMVHVKKDGIDYHLQKYNFNKDY